MYGIPHILNNEYAVEIEPVENGREPEGSYFIFKVLGVENGSAYIDPHAGAVTLDEAAVRALIPLTAAGQADRDNLVAEMVRNAELAEQLEDTINQLNEARALISALAEHARLKAYVWTTCPQLKALREYALRHGQIEPKEVIYG